MRPLALLMLITVFGCGGPDADLRDDLAALIDESAAEVVGIYFRNLETGDSLALNADIRMHAASMMKVPVMIQLYRDHEAGLLHLDDGIPVRKSFPSIVDGSEYEIGAPNDSDTLIYKRVGELVPRRWLMDRMITVSSNLATNILIEEVGAARTTATMREFGADSIEVLRGVEDIKAFEAGLSNSTTARDLGHIFSAIATMDAARDASCREMIEILSRQAFNDGIPLRLPAGTRVAHKTGFITAISHDGGIVYPLGGDAYVLVILTRGIPEADLANSLIADLSYRIYEYAIGDS